MSDQPAQTHPWVQATDSPGVVIGFLFPQDVSGWFAFGLADLIRLDAQGHNHISQANGGLIAVSSGPRVGEARNVIIDEFAKDYPHAEWLLMLDSDMTFSATLLDQLMAVADPEKVPIVGGLCFTGGRQHDPLPTIYREVRDEEHDTVTVERVRDYPRDALVKVGATGAACLLVHRQVLAVMKKNYDALADGRKNPYPWFAEGVIGPHGEAWGEDILFCLRATSLGIPIHVHTGVKLGHVKNHIVDEVYFDNYWEQRRLDDLVVKGTTGETPKIEIDNGQTEAVHGEEPKPVPPVESITEPHFPEVTNVQVAPVPDYGPNRAERRRRAREVARR